MGIESLAKAKQAHALKRLPPIASDSQKYGCGLAYLTNRIGKHKNENKRYNRLPVQLIGAQAIALAQFGYRLADCLQYPQKLMGKKTQTHCPFQISSISQNFCDLYFNLLVLFFPNFVNITVWTVGYAIPYHARKLYNEYKIGFGILSLQAKESKHAGIKRELMLTNRSTSSSIGGKWWQIMRANYVRSFYLPENQPSPPTYSSHFKSRTPISF